MKCDQRDESIIRQSTGDAESRACEERMTEPVPEGSPLDIVDAPASQLANASKVTVGRAGARALLGLPARRPVLASEISDIVKPEAAATSTVVTVQEMSPTAADASNEPENKESASGGVQFDDNAKKEDGGGFPIKLVGSMRGSIKGTQGRKNRKPKADVELGKMFEKMEQTFKDEEKVDGLSIAAGASAIQSLTADGAGTIDSYSKYRDALERGIASAGISSVDVLDTALSKGFVRDAASGDLAQSGGLQSQGSLDNVGNAVSGGFQTTQDLEDNHEKEEEDKSVHEEERKLHRKLSNMDMLAANSSKDEDDPMEQLKRIFHVTSDYREKVIKEGEKPQANGEFHPKVESHLMYVASAVINDAWSRRWFNLNRFETSTAVRAHNILLNPYYKMLIKASILLHMLLAIFEPAGTFRNPSCGQWINVPALLGIEAFFIAVYISAIILMNMAFGGTIFSMKKDLDKGRKTHPMITTIITAVIFLDWILRATAFYSPSLTHPGYSFSRPLRPILLLANSRPLRDMFVTISRVMPSVSALTLGCFLLILCFSVVGFHLFNGTYPEDSYPENFDSWPIASVLLFALFTTENYPECMTGAMTYSPWFAIYFLVVMIIGQSLLTIMLGLVYDAYRQSVMKTALKNYRKEREALTAAFALVAMCPAKKHCARFPCRHGEGHIDLMSWTRLFTSFKLHPSNTYVHKVFNRNAGGLHNAQISLIASELFKAAVEKPRAGAKPEKAAEKKTAQPLEIKTEAPKFVKNPEFDTKSPQAGHEGHERKKSEGAQEAEHTPRVRKLSEAADQVNHERKKSEGPSSENASGDPGAAASEDENKSGPSSPAAGGLARPPPRAKRKSVMLKQEYVLINPF
jgi:hypothetical protein